MMERLESQALLPSFQFQMLVRSLPQTCFTSPSFKTTRRQPRRKQNVSRQGGRIRVSDKHRTARQALIDLKIVKNTCAL